MSNFVKRIIKNNFKFDKEIDLYVLKNNHSVNLRTLLQILCYYGFYQGQLTDAEYNKIKNIDYHTIKRAIKHVYNVYKVRRQRYETARIGLQQKVDNIQEHTMGVYYLYHYDTLVYIGKSVNISNRINTHIIENLKKFTDFTYQEVVRSELDFTEKEEIIKYKPKYNIQFLK